MKTILTFIGGVAVGILAVTGIYALEEEAAAPFEEVEDLDDEEREDEFEDEDPLVINGS